MITDMTRGTPRKVLWHFAMPMLLSVAFQQMYNLADSVVVGRFVGEDALAAVGASYPVTMIFMAVATGCNIGCSVVVSQLFGAKEIARMKTAVSTSFAAALTLAAVFTGGGLWLCLPMLRALQTPENIMGDSAVYLNVYILGLVFLFLYNMCTAVFTALGDSRTPLYFLIASSLANVGMDVLFVAVFQMGVAGVAWATFLCQGVAGILAAIALYRRMQAFPVAEHKRFSWHELYNIGVVAVPSILQQSFISVGNLFIQWLVNGYGSAVVAGYSSGMKLNTFAIMGFSILSSSISSFTAQNMGAGDTVRVRQGFRAGVGMTLLVALAFTGLYIFAAEPCIRLFLPTASPEAMSVGKTFLYIIAPFYATISIKLACDGVLRGAGSMGPFMIATFTDLILRVIMAYALAPHFGATGVWLSWPLGWVVACVLSLVFYKSGCWQRGLRNAQTAK